MNSNYTDAPKYKSWIKKIKNSKCKIEKIVPLHIINKPNGELLFALLDADILTPQNEKLLPYIFLRGDASLIVPLIINSDTGEKKLLMIRQRRIANGEINLEFPAGMVDLNTDKPTETAISELSEETGVTISQSDIFKLSSKPFYSSPGASDEAIFYYGAIIKMGSSLFNSLEGRLTGDKSENEHIQVTLKSISSAEEKLTSLQGRLGLELFLKKYSSKKFS